MSPIGIVVVSTAIVTAAVLVATCLVAALVPHESEEVAASNGADRFEPHSPRNVAPRNDVEPELATAGAAEWS